MRSLKNIIASTCFLFLISSCEKKVPEPSVVNQLNPTKSTTSNCPSPGNYTVLFWTDASQYVVDVTVLTFGTKQITVGGSPGSCQNQSGQATFVFSSAGTYNYTATNHAGGEWSGTIVVKNCCTIFEIK